MDTYKIDRLGHLGDGIATTATGPAYFPRTLPGEEVTLADDGAPRIVTPSDQRVKAPCRHFKSCGGCAVQHASDEFVATWKEGIVRQALAAQGLDAPFRPIVTSPANSRRRATFAGKRTKKGAMIGFHAPAANTLIPVPDCQLVTPALLAARPLLEQITLLGASRKGEIALTVTETLGGLDISVAGGKELEIAEKLALAALVNSGKLLRLTWNDEPLGMRETPMVSFDGINTPLPAGAFLQATSSGEAALRDAVFEIVGAARNRLDLFAGCGTFTLPLARNGPVTAVEALPEMLHALDQGWRNAKGLRAVKTVTRDLFRNPYDPADLKPYDAVLIDPPRAGAEAQMRELAASAVPVIAAVSCNPASFARDAKMLIEGGYSLNWVQVVDQFRWSTHVELVASLTKAHMPKR